MPRWYYSTNGKAEGPVTPEFLVESLKAGKFTLVDLVFQEGESAWKTFGEIPEFREAYQAPPVFVPVPPVSPSFDVELHKPSDAKQHEAQADAGPIVMAESNTVSQFVKPQDGWPSDWRLSSSWIVLRKRDDGTGYEQDGPYSAEHIIEMIGQGKIEYSQYCWKPGYTRWFRIGNLPEFDRRKRDRENDQVNQIVPVPAINESLPALSREELLANVERLRRDRRAEQAALADVQPKPPEAVTENLTDQPVFAAAPVAAPVPKASSFVTAASVTEALPTWDELLANQRVTETPAARASSKRFQPNQKMLRFGVAFAIAIAVVFAMVQFGTKTREPASTPVDHSKKKSPKAKSAEIENPVAAPAPADETAKADAPSSATATMTAPLAPKTASVLEILALKLESATPSLTFQTDAGPADVIKVRLRGRTGEILKFASYSKNFDVTRSGGELPTLDLAKLELPTGAYTVEASVGSVLTSQSIFIGERNAAFTSALEQHIKSISYRQQAERSALFYGSMKLEKLAKSLIAQSQALKTQPLKWKKALTDWRMAAREASLPVVTLTQVGENDSVYPDQLAMFQGAITKLADQAKTIDEAMKQKREIANEGGVTETVNQLATDFSHLREESARLSGRPQASN